MSATGKSTEAESRLVVARGKERREEEEEKEGNFP